MKQLSHMQHAERSSEQVLLHKRLSTLPMANPNVVMTAKRKRSIDVVAEESSGVSLSPTKKSKLDLAHGCGARNCDFCLNGISVLMKYEMRKQGWKQRLVVAFSSIEKSNPSKGAWHSLSNEVYPFLESHWQNLWCGVDREMVDSWRKKVQDCLTHNKDMFESGVSKLGKKGYWRMLERMLDGTMTIDCSDKPIEQCNATKEDKKSSASPPPVQCALSTNIIKTLKLAPMKSKVTPIQELIEIPPLQSITKSHIQNLINSTETSPSTFFYNVDSALEKEFTFFLQRSGVGATGHQYLRPDLATIKPFSPPYLYLTPMNAMESIV